MGKNGGTFFSASGTGFRGSAEEEDFAGSEEVEDMIVATNFF